MSAPKELCLRSAGKEKKTGSGAPSVETNLRQRMFLYLDDSLLGGPDKDDIDEVRSSS
jgi:hypothetical protein